MGAQNFVKPKAITHDRILVDNGQGQYCLININRNFISFQWILRTLVNLEQSLYTLVLINHHVSSFLLLRSFGFPRLLTCSRY